MQEIYFTLVGMDHFYGLSPLRINNYVQCVKEPDNVIDSEAIKVVAPYIGTVGYVANSTHTTAGGCYSAEQLGELITKKNFYAKICFIAHKQIICKVVDDKEIEDLAQEVD